MITMETIVEKISKTALEIRNLGIQPNSYLRINTLAPALEPQYRTLYIGYSSDINDSYVMNENIGLILIPDDLKVLDRKFNCELTLSQAGQDFMELFHHVQNIFQAEYENVSYLSLLLDGLTHGKDTKELIEIGAKILGNPIMLTNSSYKVIALSDDEDFDDTVWADARKYGCCSSESIAVFKEDKYSNILYDSSKAFIYDTGLGEKIPRILRKITIEGKAVGYICIFGLRHALGKKDLEMADILCDLLALDMKNSFSAGDFTNVIYESLIYDLLDSKIKINVSLSQRLKAANWSIKAVLGILLIEVDKSGNTPYYCDYIRRQINDATNSAKSLIYDDNIVVVINSANVKEYKDAVKSIETVMEHNKMSGGLSKPLNNIADLKNYYRQAINALETGKMLEPKKVLHTYEDLNIYYIFSKLDENELVGLTHPDYYKLLEYDRLNSTDYCRTLYVYLLSGSNIHETANRIFIHRNTMTYRLKKISEIVQFDLSNGEEICMYLMTHKIEKWLSVTRKK